MDRVEVHFLCKPTYSGSIYLFTFDATYYRLSISIRMQIQMEVSIVWHIDGLIKDEQL